MNNPVSGSASLIALHLIHYFILCAAAVKFCGKFCTEKLDQLGDADQQHYRHDHNIALVAVVAVADRDIAKPASSDDAGHCGIAEDRAEADCHSDNERGSRLGDQDAGDDCPVIRAHGLRRLDYAVIDLP